MDCCDLWHTFKNKRHINGPTNHPSSWDDLIMKLHETQFALEGPPYWVCFAPPDVDQTLAGTGLVAVDPYGWADQVLTLFKPSRVDAKRILKPINIIPVSLIGFSMQRIPHGVQPVCFPTFIGQLHSLCISKIFQQGFFFALPSPRLVTWWLIPHSEVALPGVGEGKVCGVGCGEVSPDPSREFVFFICLYNRSTATVPWSSSQVWAQMGACKCPVRCNTGILMFPRHHAIIKLYTASLICSRAGELYKTSIAQCEWQRWKKKFNMPQFAFLFAFDLKQNENILPSPSSFWIGVLPLQNWIVSKKRRQSMGHGAELFEAH